MRFPSILSLWGLTHGLPGTHFKSSFHSGTNSDGRHSWHSGSFLVNSHWLFKVLLGLTLPDSETKTKTSNDHLPVAPLTHSAFHPPLIVPILMDKSPGLLEVALPAPPLHHLHHHHHHHKHCSGPQSGLTWTCCKLACNRKFKVHKSSGLSLTNTHTWHEHVCSSRAVRFLLWTLQYDE